MEVTFSKEEGDTTEKQIRKTSVWAEATVRWRQCFGGLAKLTLTSCITNLSLLNITNPTVEEFQKLEF